MKSKMILPTLVLASLTAAVGCSAVDEEPTDSSSDQVTSARAPISVSSTTEGTICAAYRNGKVKCWGDDHRGGLGDGPVVQRELPYTVAPAHYVAGLEDATQLVAGRGHTCALRKTGTVVCWGENMNRQISPEPLDTVDTPMEIEGLSGVKQIAASWRHACALSDDGIRCWGTGLQAIAEGTPTLKPVRSGGVSGLLPHSAGIVSIATDPWRIYGVTADRKVVYWGSEGHNLGEGTLSGLDDVVELKAYGTLEYKQDQTYACARLANGHVKVLGRQQVRPDGRVLRLGQGCVE